jgi:hypothetical protein
MNKLEHWIRTRHTIPKAMCDLLQECFDHLNIPYGVDTARWMIAPKALTKFSLSEVAPGAWAFGGRVYIVQGILGSTVKVWKPQWLAALFHEVFHLYQEERDSWWLLRILWTIARSLRGKNWHSAKFEQEAHQQEMFARVYLCGETVLPRVEALEDEVGGEVVDSNMDSES